MTEPEKPRYELRRRSKNYVGLWEGDHCLCAICTRKPRGVLDAQSLLLAMNSHKDLLELVKRYADLINEGHAECSNVECVACLERKQAEAAIEKAGSTL